MSDFKFSCPACGQHLAGDVRYGGTQLRCPACQQSFIVPAPPAPAPVGAAASSGGAPLQTMVPGRAASSPSLPVAAQRLGGPARTSRLALASLICSIGSFILIPLGFIPGIICGHMAKRRIAQDPTLAGRGLAKVGLIVGYLALGIQGLALLGVLGFFLFVGAKVAHQVSAPDAEGWALQLKGVSIPAGPVSGRIKGRNFVSENASIQGGWLKFAQGADSVADLEMDVVLVVNLSAELSGKTFTVPNQKSGANPQVWMKWKQAGKATPEEKSWMEGYAMKLEFGKALNGKLPGKIYLCVPDDEKSFIRGTFEVPLRRERGAPAVPPGR
jgi:hypothetical protein